MKLCRSTGTVGSIACNRSQATADCTLIKSTRAPDSVTSGKQLAVLHVERLRGRGEGAAVESVTAEDDVVDVHGLHQAIDGGARGLNLRRNAGAIVSAHAVFASQRKNVRGRKALAEKGREGFTDPLQAGSARGVGKRDDDDRVG